MRLSLVGVLAACALVANDARSREPKNLVRNSPVGIEFVRALGTRAESTLAPTTGQIGALVEIPEGKRAADYGLESVVPGIGRIRGSAAKLGAFADLHPDLRFEASPPLHPLMDNVGKWIRSTVAVDTRGVDGTGVLVGVADTGLDVVNAEVRDGQGKSRVAWLLDLSLPPGGIHPDLEERFGVKDDSGKVTFGRVFSRDEIDALLVKIDSGNCKEENGLKCAPQDESGHGTHVTGIATATGAHSVYRGVAPKADIVFVKLTKSPFDGIEDDNVLRAVDFMFDRADAEKKPMVVNLSIGSDFGPHDGTALWEQTIAGMIGPEHPGRAIVAAAGNSGSIVETPIHQSVRVTHGTRMHVPVTTHGADAGSVQIWVTLRRNADIQIGLDGPDGEWISPVANGEQAGKKGSGYDAAVVYGPDVKQSPIPKGSRGAIVAWQGAWPSGTYNVTLEGEGMVELYLQGLGDVGLGGDKPASFRNGVREGTINLPATNASIIGVGCTVNRPRWTSIAGVDMGLKVPLLDHEGGIPIQHAITPQTDTTAVRDLIDGEVCWFSSAGPTAAGVPKPEIAAPGALVVSALSRSAKPGSAGSVFTNPACPATKDGKHDIRCLQVDDNHGIAIGTSMSSPVVAGVVALLLEKDPTLTQDKIVALLQGGAHRYRTLGAFDYEAGPGEVDAIGSLDALDQMNNPKLLLPALEKSWLTMSGDYVPADGSTAMTAILELRTEDGAHRSDMFDLQRLRPVLLVDDKPQAPPQIVRRGPGVYFFVWEPPPGLGGSRATFGATFDGAPIVATQTLNIAPDRWTALYPSHATGSGCSTAPSPRSAPPWIVVFAFGALAIILRRR